MAESHKETATTENQENDNEIQHRCVICEKDFPSKRALISHSISHKNKIKSPNPCKDFTCEICGKKYASKKYLNKHRKYHDKERPKPFECDTCGMHFTCRKFLARHIRTHTGERPFACDYCDQTFMDEKTCEHHKKFKHFKIDLEIRYKCNVCGKGFHHKSVMMKHYKSHIDQTFYKCNICSQEFKWKNGYDAHMRSHTGENCYTCETCGKTYTVLQTYKVHLNTHTHEKEFKCDICSKVFYKRGNLTKHRAIHFDEKPYKCKYCDKAFKQNSTMHTHEETHKPRHLRKQKEKKSYSCEICKKTFSAKCSLTDHMRIHSGDLYKCDVCNRDFSVLKSFIIHKRTHTKKITDKCHLCGRGFICRGYLLKHLKNHAGVSNYECDVCGIKYKHLLNLQRHKLIHTGEKPFSCSVCDRGFLYKCFLKEHMKIHDPSAPKKAKKFKCNVCNKGFTNQWNMNKHINTVHEGLKPYKCDTCDKCFSMKANLQKHMLQHTGYRPYECSKCGFKTITNSRLKSHYKIVHEGERNFECTICNKRFSIKLNLKKHMENHHNDKPKTEVDENEILKRYKCYKCKKRFISKANVKRHLKNVHKTQLPNCSPYLRPLEVNIKTENKVRDKCMMPKVDKKMKNSPTEVRWKRLKDCIQGNKTAQWKSEVNDKGKSAPNRFGNLFDNKTGQWKSEVNDKGKGAPKRFGNLFDNITQELENKFKQESPLDVRQDDIGHTTFITEGQSKDNCKTDLISHNINSNVMQDVISKIEHARIDRNNVDNSKGKRHGNLFENLSKITENSGNSIQSSRYEMGETNRDKSESRNVFQNLLKFDKNESRSDKNLDNGNKVDTDVRKTYNIFDRMSEMTGECVHGNIFDNINKTIAPQNIPSITSQEEAEHIAPVIISGNVIKVGNKPLIDGFILLTADGRITVLEDTSMSLENENGGDLPQTDLQNDHSNTGATNLQIDGDRNNHDNATKESHGMSPLKDNSGNRLFTNGHICVESNNDDSIGKFSNNEGGIPHIIASNGQDSSEHLNDCHENKSTDMNIKSDDVNKDDKGIGIKDIGEDKGNGIVENKISENGDKENGIKEKEVNGDEENGIVENIVCDKGNIINEKEINVDKENGINEKQVNGIKEKEVNGDKENGLKENMAKDDKENDIKEKEVNRYQENGIKENMASGDKNNGIKEKELIGDKGNDIKENIANDDKENGTKENIVKNNQEKDNENKMNSGIENNLKENMTKGNKGNEVNQKEISDDNEKSSKTQTDVGRKNIFEMVQAAHKENDIEKKHGKAQTSIGQEKLLNTSNKLKISQEKIYKAFNKRSGNIFDMLNSMTSSERTISSVFDKTDEFNKGHSAIIDKKQNISTDKAEKENKPDKGDCKDKVDKDNKYDKGDEKVDKDNKEICCDNKVEEENRERENGNKTDPGIYENLDENKVLVTKTEKHNKDNKGSTNTDFDQAIVNTDTITYVKEKQCDADKIDKNNTRRKHSNSTDALDKENVTLENDASSFENNVNDKIERDDKANLTIDKDKKEKDDKENFSIDKEANNMRNGNVVEQENFHVVEVANVDDMCLENGNDVEDRNQIHELNSIDSNIEENNYANKDQQPNKADVDKPTDKVQDENKGQNVQDLENQKHPRKMKMKKREKDIEKRDDVDTKRLLIKNKLGSGTNNKKEEKNNLTTESNKRRKNAIINKKFYFNRRSIPLTKHAKEKCKTEDESGSQDVSVEKSHENVSVFVKTEQVNHLSIREKIKQNGIKKFKINGLKSHRKHDDTQGACLREDESADADTAQRTELEDSITCNSDFTTRNANSDSQRKQLKEKGSEKTNSPCFLCQVCYKEFSCRKKLRTHSFTHTRKYMFSCQICDKGFYWEDHLERHLSIH